MKNLDYSYKIYRRICILLFISVVLLFNIKDAFAQFPILRSEQEKRTFFYVQTKYWSSDENVWRKPNGDYIQKYYTFTDYNCFDSDANGYPPSNGGLVYNYYGRKDGMIYYRYYDLQWLIVSEDYKIVTTILEFKNGSSYHEVFEMRDPSSTKKFSNISPQSNSSSNNKSSTYTPSSPQIRSSQGNYNNNSNSLKSSSDRYTCGMCNGTGKCKDCGGKGVRWNKYSDTWDACPYCNGANGICKWCNGKGYKTY